MGQDPGLVGGQPATPYGRPAPPNGRLAPLDVDINTSDTSTPTHNQISGPITWAHAPTKLSGNLVPSSLFIYLENGNVHFLLLPRNDRQNEIEFDSGDIWIPEQQQIVMAAPTTYGLELWRANTFWKDPGVYFHMHQTSSPYHVRAGRNRHFSADTFFYQRCYDTLFWPIEPCIM
jgi:hypothetical protein